MIYLYMENTDIEKIWELISLKLTNEANEVELLELQALLQQQPEQAFALEIMQYLWNEPANENKQYAEYQYKELTQKMQKKDEMHADLPFMLSI